MFGVHISVETRVKRGKGLERRAVDCLAVDAVSCEPLSLRLIPDNREKYRDFSDFSIEVPTENPYIALN